MNDTASFAISLALPESKVSIPQAFALDVQLVYPLGYKPDKEALLEHLLRKQGTSNQPPFQMISSEEELTSLNEHLQQETIHYQLEAQLPGKFALTFLAVPFINQDSLQSKVEIASPVEYVEITLPEIKKIEIFQEAVPWLNQIDRAPMELNAGIRQEIFKDHSKQFEELFASRVFPWQPLIWGILFSLMVGWIFFILKKRPQNKQLLVPSTTPFQQAEQNLHMLLKQTQPESSLVENFMVQLTNSLRHYFEKKFNILASKKTTPEFMQEIRNQPFLASDQKAKIEAFLEASDQVKFAAYKPSKKECQEAFKIVKAIIEEPDK